MWNEQIVQLIRDWGSKKLLNNYKFFSISQQKLKILFWGVYLYKSELASPLRYDSLFTTLSAHSYSISLLTWTSEY